MNSSVEITVLCKVIDNFGDIGVVYRLAKKLIKNTNNILQVKKINLITDDLYSFKKINNLINPILDFQKVEGMDIFNWNNYSLCYENFIKDGFQVILECFQCGRPDWMEKILFDNVLEKVVNIIMIDYLSAEDYAETFHCLQSLTRRKLVQKVNFMPGFTDKTGGLLLNDNVQKEERYSNSILFFCYDRDWALVLKSIDKVCKLKGTNVLAAPGRGLNSFEKAYEDNNCTFCYTKMDFMNQSDWDVMLNSCKFLFVRGEDSLSEACLSGIPFVWHAYPQSDDYQLVKVKALLGKMKSFFCEEHFIIIEKIWLYVNNSIEISDSEFSDNLDIYLFNIEDFTKEFINFSESLRRNGDLSENLMTFISKKIIM